MQSVKFYDILFSESPISKNTGRERDHRILPRRDEWCIMDDFTSRVDLQKIITEEALQVLYTPDEPSKIMVSSSDVNRPGLALAGFFDHFDHKRIQILGNAESVYLKICRRSCGVNG